MRTDASALTKPRARIHSGPPPLLAVCRHPVKDGANQLLQWHTLGPCAMSTTGQSHALSQLGHSLVGIRPALAKVNRITRATTGVALQHQLGLGECKQTIGADAIDR